MLNGKASARELLLERRQLDSLLDGGDAALPIGKRPCRVITGSDGRGASYNGRRSPCRRLGGFVARANDGCRDRMSRHGVYPSTCTNIRCVGAGGLVGGTVERDGNVLEVVERRSLRLLDSTAIHQDQQVSTPLTPRPILASC